MKKILSITAVLLIVFLFFGCKPKVTVKPLTGNDEKASISVREPNKDMKQYPDIEAVELITKYKENAEAAMLEYDEKSYAITGVVEMIGEDEIGRPYVVLGKEGGDGFNAVTFIFTKNDLTELSRLKMGDTATIKGTVHDYLMNVIIYDCSILSIKK